MNVDPSAPWWAAGGLATSHLTSAFVSLSQVKEAMQRIHDRGNIGKLILDVEKTPTPLVSQQWNPFSSTHQGLQGAGTGEVEGNTGSCPARRPAVVKGLRR